MKFRNPANNYILSGSGSLSWLWCLLFGPLYFLFKGNIVHALLSLVLAIATSGVSIFLYPFFVYQINDDYFLRKGWIPIK